jgi:sn-glycerol 3-phosphate transport system substrate-binding protein
MEAFLTQRVAFMYSSSKLTPVIVQAGEEAGFPVEVSPLPYNGSVPYAGTVVSGHSFWLAAGLDKPTEDGVLAFLQRLISPDNAMAWHKAQAFVPITRTAFGGLEQAGWFEEHPYERVATDQQNASDRSAAALGALLGDFAGIQDAATAAMHDVLAGGADPVVRFAEAAALAQQLLDDYHAHCVDGPVPRSPRRLDVH